MEEYLQMEIPEDLLKIIDLQLSDIIDNLQKKNVTISIRKSAKELLIQEGNHREWGARPLRRVIQNKIENIIAEKFLINEFNENGKIIVSSKKGELIFTFNLNPVSKKNKLESV